jgi:chemotaxis protein methyltransferase CheR
LFEKTFSLSGSKTMQPFKNKPEIPLSENEFNRFQQLTHERTGIFFGPRRRTDLQRHINKLLKKQNTSDINSLYQNLALHETNSPIWDMFIDAIIVGETYFFREKLLFQALQQIILPDIIQRHQNDKSLRIWSAGCSTGEEPYSLSMLLDQLLGPEIKLWRIFILATDINKPSLKKGIDGLYRKWSLRQTPDNILSTYFQKENDLYRIREDIQKRVMFSYLNLKDPVYPDLSTCTHAMDLILWRNVAIYLSDKVIADVLKRFYQSLMPLGYFNIGASEAGYMGSTPFVSKQYSGAFIYQKLPSPKQSSIFPGQTDKKSISMEKRTEFNKTFPFKAEPPRKPEPVLSAKNLLEQAKQFAKDRNYILAIDRFRSYLNKNASDADVWYQLARVYANSGDLKHAKAACISAIIQDPLLVKAYYISGLIHEEKGELELAIQDYKKTLYLQSDFVLAHYHLSTIYLQINEEQQAERHRIHAIRILSRRQRDEILSGADGLTVEQLLAMIS